jgi:hypothetical protein
MESRREVADRVAAWIASLQFSDPALPSFGAVRIHHSPAALSPEGRFARVAPYDASLGLLGLLHTGVEGRLEVVERWIGWYLSRMDPTSTPAGIVYEHWYREDGSGESTCPPAAPGTDGLHPCDFVDASDSAAAAFLILLRKFVREGGGTDFLRQAGREARLVRVAEVMIELQQEDGLTWARDDFRAKYLMDNSEVYQGLIAAADLMSELYGNEVAGQRYRAAAQRVRDGILRELYDPDSGLYSVAKFEDDTIQRADLNVWYPDATLQVWPILFGVTGPASIEARRALRAVNQRWDDRHAPAWTDNLIGGHSWVSVSYASLLAGDRERAVSHADFVILEKLTAPPGGRSFRWPFSVDDGGWLLMTLSALGR